MKLDSSTVDRSIQIAEAAGVVLMRYFRDNVGVDYKDDHSPVTIADVESSNLIVAALQQLTPDIPVISEEEEAVPQSSEYFWLVDPLDGTRAYIRGEDEFCVCIGLIKNKRAIFGVIHSPVHHYSYVGGVGVAPFKQAADGQRVAIQTRAPNAADWITIRSASHASDKLKAYLESYPTGETIGMSSALKFGLIAEGKADLYPRLGRTMEWDTAAGQAIVEAAGGGMQTIDGEVFSYGKSGFENPGFVVFARSPMKNSM